MNKLEGFPSVYYLSLEESIDRRNHLKEQFKEYGIENFYIELIEAYPCENNEELRKREGHYIREVGTFNKRIEGRTRQEYREDHRKKIKEYYEASRVKLLAQMKEYRQNNREKVLARAKEYDVGNRDAISERRKTPYSCACGFTCRVANKAQHLRTKKHQDFITNLDTTTQTES